MSFFRLLKICYEAGDKEQTTNCRIVSHNLSHNCSRGLFSSLCNMRSCLALKMTVFWKILEATARIELAYTDLQSAASPLRHVASAHQLGRDN